MFDSFRSQCSISLSDFVLITKKKVTDDKKDDQRDRVEDQRAYPHLMTESFLPNNPTRMAMGAATAPIIIRMQLVAPPNAHRA